MDAAQHTSPLCTLSAQALNQAREAPKIKPEAGKAMPLAKGANSGAAAKELSHWVCAWFTVALA